MDEENNQQIETQSPKDILKLMDEVLDKYEKSIMLNLNQNHQDADKYLNMNQEQMRLLSAEECAEASILLSQLALYIKKNENIELSRVKLANQKLQKAYKYEDNFTGSFEAKRTKAIQQDSSLMSWLSIKNYAELRHTRLSGIVDTINKLADQYKTLHFSKMKGK